MNLEFLKKHIKGFFRGRKLTQASMDDLAGYLVQQKKNKCGGVEVTKLSVRCTIPKHQRRDATTDPQTDNDLAGNATNKTTKQTNKRAPSGVVL
jgi:hypothetical protein